MYDYRADNSRQPGAGTVQWMAAAGVLAGVAYLALAQRRQRSAHPVDNAPWHARSGRTADGSGRIVGRTVTINRPKAELYAFWKDLTNLPRFMANVQRIEPRSGGRARWTIAAPLGQSVEVETEIVEDRQSELIAWRSTPESEIATEGRVVFRDAPGERGTEVEALISYVPPAGAAGRLVAQLLGREPAVQARHELKRFKMLMETGEIATRRNQPETAAHHAVATERPRAGPPV